ncbi:MAG TPA: response regulator [Allosphingosinicella sp.]
MHAQWRKTALVVDDEAFARLYAVQMLLDQGWFVLEAADAEEGLDMLVAQDDLALLLTDISMPGEMDGLDLVERARRHQPEIAIVVTSGQTIPSAERLPEGARFLPKPYTAFALNEAIGAHSEPFAHEERIVLRA